MTHEIGINRSTCSKRPKRILRRRAVILSSPMQELVALTRYLLRRDWKVTLSIPRLTSLTPAAATEDPTKPELRILNINLTGVLYTTKIAMNYFRLQPEDPERDRCFIFKGSIAGLLDQPGSWQYSTSKFGLRGLMRSMRHTTWQSGIRVNYVGPCTFTLPVLCIC